MKTPKLTPAAIHTLQCIAKGQTAVFYMRERPAGWIHIERAGLAVRVDDIYAALTDAGRQYLSSK